MRENTQQVMGHISLGIMGNSAPLKMWSEVVIPHNRTDVFIEVRGTIKCLEVSREPLFFTIITFPNHPSPPIQKKDRNTCEQWAAVDDDDQVWSSLVGAHGCQSRDSGILYIRVERQNQPLFHSAFIETTYAMPESASYTNGYGDSAGGKECEDQETFLFTSESVGEGHPGEKKRNNIEKDPVYI